MKSDPFVYMQPKVCMTIDLTWIFRSVSLPLKNRMIFNNEDLLSSALK